MLNLSALKLHSIMYGALFTRFFSFALETDNPFFVRLIVSNPNICLYLRISLWFNIIPNLFSICFFNLIVPYILLTFVCSSDIIFAILESKLLAIGFLIDIHL